MSKEGTWKPPTTAPAAPPPIIGKIERVSDEEREAVIENASAHPPDWEVIAVNPVTRKVLDGGVEQEIAKTVVLMRDRHTGEMKSWEARGTFTLEQMRAK